MAQKTLAEIWDDPKFKGASPDVQRAVLSKLGVSGDRVDKLLAKLGTGGKDAGQAYDEYLQSGEPTSVPREPGHGRPASFMTRTSQRIGSDIKAAFDLPGMVNQFEEGVKHRPPGGYLFSEEGRRQMLEPLKAYKDPANVAGDVIAGIGLHAAGSEPGERATRTRTATSPRTEVTPTAPTAPLPESLRRTQPLNPEQQARYTEALDKANREHAQALVDYAEKESRARAKWVEKAYGAKKSAADQVAAANKREILNRGSDEYTRLTQDNIRSTHDNVRSSLDQRWGSLRQGMRGTEVAGPEDIYNGIKEAEAEHLRGSPQSLQQFRNIIKELGIKDFAEAEDGSLTAVQSQFEDAKPLDWETARVHYSAIGDRLASGNLPGNVYQALKSVHELLDEKLADAAQSAGREAEYSALKQDWSQYMKDWRDTSAVSGGGSPLAKAFQSKDPGFVKLQVTGKAGDRLLETFARYKKYGARPDLATHARNLAAQAKALPPVKATPMPPGYEPAPLPRLREVPVPRGTPGTTPVPEGPSKGARLAARFVGKVAGAAGGAAIGHPFVGYATGGEAGEALLNKWWRAKKNRLQTNAPGVRPPDPGTI